MCRSKASINQRTTGGALKTGRLDEKYKGYKPVVDIKEGLFLFIKKTVQLAYRHRLSAQKWDTINVYMYYIQYNIGTSVGWAGNT